MRIWLVGHLVFLLVIANGTPVLLGLALGARWNWPLDNHLQFTDQRPVLGPSKTLRGLIGSLLVTALLAPLLQLSLLDGARFAMLAMLGDLCSSFTKRRFGSCIRSLGTATRPVTGIHPATLGHANGTRVQRDRDGPGGDYLYGD